MSSGSSATSGSPSPPPSSPDPPTTEEEDGTMSPVRPGQGGMKFMAVMMMCACVLYAPSPFEDSNGRHVHSQGKIVEELGGPVGGGGGEYRRTSEIWIVGSSALWAIAKFIFVTICMFNFTSSFTSPKRRPLITAKVATASIAASALTSSSPSTTSPSTSHASTSQQLASLTGTKTPSSTFSATLSLLSESIRFLLNHFLSLGTLTERILESSDSHRTSYFRAVADVSVRVLETGIGGGWDEASPIVRLYHCLRSINFNELAARKGGEVGLAKTYLLTGLQLRFLGSHIQHAYGRSFIRGVATYFWSMGVSKARVSSSAPAEKNEKPATDVAWIARQDGKALNRFFEDGEWIPLLESGGNRRPLDAFADTWRVVRFYEVLRTGQVHSLAARHGIVKQSKRLTEFMAQVEELRRDAVASEDEVVGWYAAAVITILKNGVDGYGTSVLSSPLMEAEKQRMGGKWVGETALSRKLVLVALFAAGEGSKVEREAHLKTLKALNAALGARRKALKTVRGLGSAIVGKMAQVVEMLAVSWAVKALVGKGAEDDVNGEGSQMRVRDRKMEVKLAKKGFAHMRRLLPVLKGLGRMEDWMDVVLDWQEGIQIL
ncbi:hypothetical protein HK097_002265 [Rhizophlyctis rosea]|uniref:Uncharacterized protein n=1 Tax=Rhizophlyctis rosea TaxID=64517 RepID=A0AAD5X1C0_9FUNG|nr:hypothetical protein HK097_002265 [Rhizophlyctis rosea]